MTPVLSIRDLTVSYRLEDRWLPAVSGFSLEILEGQTCGLVGESGSGKSTVALAIMGYLSEGGRIDSGSIRFNGEELAGLPREKMRPYWGSRIALVPQNPQSALNPSLRIGDQLSEVFRLHADLSKSSATERSEELLTSVRISDPGRVANSYPHQISGGMQQRVMIAMALAAEPALLILDEPTTNLDVTTQAEILDLVRDLVREMRTAALYVTHNLGVVARLCDRVAVLYAGELVEEAAAGALFRKPLHPYTQGLMESIPQPGKIKAEFSLRSIPGRIPRLDERVGGCVFTPRCPFAIEICKKHPPLETTGDQRQVRCHRWQEIDSGELERPETQSTAGESEPAGGGEQILIDLDEVQVHFEVRRSLREILEARKREYVRAVDGLNLEIPRGATIGLVGESGSGKTTLAKSIVGLLSSTGGSIELLGRTLPRSLAERDLQVLRQLQYVFQNPEEALNPYMTVGETLARPYITLLSHSADEARAAVDRLLQSVSLSEDFAGRLPGQLSGGEKQRVAIARAIASHPALLIADEAVSGLDVSVQAAILNLLRELQSSEGNTLLFISHDLAVVGYLSDIVAVMYAGQLMEIADSRALFEPPYHPYTEALLSAIPVPDPDVVQETVRLKGEPSSQTEKPSGCPFHPRCPRYLGEICRDETPPWREAEEGQRIFCHIPLQDLHAQQEKVIR